MDLMCAYVLQPAGSLSEQSEGVVDEASVKLPERRIIREGDVFTSPGQQAGGDLNTTFSLNTFKAELLSMV